MEIEVLDDPTLSDLRHLLINETWEILHFMGDGGFDETMGDGVLCFESASGTAERVPAWLLGENLWDA